MTPLWERLELSQTLTWFHQFVMFGAKLWRFSPRCIQMEKTKQACGKKHLSTGENRNLSHAVSSMCPLFSSASGFALFRVPMTYKRNCLSWWNSLWPRSPCHVVSLPYNPAWSAGLHNHPSQNVAGIWVYPCSRQLSVGCVLPVSLSDPSSRGADWWHGQLPQPSRR